MTQITDCIIAWQHFQQEIYIHHTGSPIGSVFNDNKVSIYSKCIYRPHAIGQGAHGRCCALEVYYLCVIICCFMVYYSCMTRSRFIIYNVYLFWWRVHPIKAHLSDTLCGQRCCMYCMPHVMFSCLKTCLQSHVHRPTAFTWDSVGLTLRNKR